MADDFQVHFSQTEYGPLEDYAEEHSSRGGTLLEELVRTTWQRSIHPRMLSGEYQGRILSMVSCLLRPQRILEIGTFTGYSALCLSEGLVAQGELITVDCNEEIEDFARSFFARSPRADSIRMVVGDARQVVPALEGDFDLVFVDGEKSEYPQYLDLVASRVRIGGVLMADNVLWNGKVLREPRPGDRDTAAVQEFNRRLASDPRFETVLLPVRDGLTIARRVR